MTIHVLDRIAGGAPVGGATAALVHLHGVIRQFSSDRVQGLDPQVPPEKFAAILGRGGCATSAVPRLIGEPDRPRGGRPPLADAARGSRRSVQLVSPRSEWLVAEAPVVA